MAARALKWILLALLVMSAVFLASFNATLRYIADERRELRELDRRRSERREEERAAWEEAGRSSMDDLLAKRKGKGGAPSVARGTRSNGNNDGNKNEKIGEKNDDDDEKVKQTEEQSKDSIDRERKKREAEKAKQRERDDPTLGKFRTTIRPLDGFAEEVVSDGVDGVEGGKGSGDDEGAWDGAKEFRDRPPVQSLSAQSARHSRGAYDTALKSSTANLADAHYAKALRMLSSDFDRLRNGGNALPHEVHAGEYDQDTGGKNGRGDKFVRMEERRGRRKTRARKTRKRASGTEGNGGKGGGSSKNGGNPFMMKGDSNWELPEDEPIYEDIWDAAQDWFADTMDWIYDTLGIEMDYDDDSSGDGSDGVSNEEEIFSWEETRVGSQLIWIYGKVSDLWSRQSRASGSTLQEEAKKAADAESSASSEGGASLSERDQIAREGLFHLEKAAELGHSEAQRMVANSLASGILPLSDHSLMHRVADYQYHRQSDEGNAKNWTSILQQSAVEVPDDFSSGGERLSRAILLWHLSAMDGNVESAMALGYRHLYSANGGSTLLSDLANAAVAQGDKNKGGGDGGMNMEYDPLTGGPTTTHGTTPISHYGVLGTCGTALAYYEAAAHGVMDALEGGPTKGKVKPPSEEHRLAEIYTHGGASVALEGHNKPDELEEALQYFRMLASRNRSPEPDLVYSFTIANFYYHGFRGVKQDLRMALKYFEICGDFDHWEGGGKAGLMHVWGMGVSPEERDLGKAYSYFAKGTPGGLDGCTDRHKRRKRQHQKKDGTTEELVLCDRHCVTGMGLLHLLGVEGLVDRNVNLARRWFEHGKDLNDPESQYNYAMLRLGWMVAELEDLPTKIPGDSTALRYHKQTKRKTQFDSNYMAYRSETIPHNTEAEARSNAEAASYAGPSSSDYNVALQELARAASHGHLQARHKLGMLYAAGASIPKKKGRPQKVVAQNCANALRYFKAVADEGHTVSRRNRAAWKQYGAGDHVSALRNYLAAAETGSEVGQVNAAFLLEQGHCMGMTKWACTRASIRLWRAAARQGNLEACLRVGDFFYYGRMKMEKPRVGPSPVANEGGVTDGERETLYDREEYLASLEAKAFYFMPGPYQWTRYILYPEELFDLMRKWIGKSVRNLRRYLSAKTPDELSSKNGEAESEVPSPQKATCDEMKGTCSAEWNENSEDDTGKETDEHMAIAAQYYRKAAEEHKSPRAHFNLGFMHEWGLGLTQDFPLAKRHFDLAREIDTSNMAPAIALWAMKVHQKVVKFGIMMQDYGEG